MDSASKVLSPTNKPPMPAGSESAASQTAGGYAARYMQTKKGLFDENYTHDGRPRTAPHMEASASFDLKNHGSGMYDSSMVHTRLRKPKPDMHQGFAGMSTHAPKWAGKFTPVRGHGLPQELGKEASEREYLRTHATKKRICPTSHTSLSVHNRDILGQSAFVGVEEEDLTHTGRRVFPDAEVTFRKGCTNTLEGEEEEWKKARGYGQPGPQYKVHSSLRVMGANPEVPIKVADPDYKVQGIKTDRPFKEREENALTLKYRYSNGISFKNYEFDPTRKIEAEQHLKAIQGEKAKTQFHGNFDSYQMFRAKMNSGSTIFADPLYEKRPQTSGGM